MPSATLNAFEDAWLQKAGGTWPPGGGATKTSDVYLKAYSGFFGGSYFLQQAHVLFDTSPYAGGEFTNVQLSIVENSKTGGGTIYFTWLPSPDGSIDAADYVDLPSGDAYQIDLGLVSGTDGNRVTYTLNLPSPATIGPVTGLCIHLYRASPPGVDNYILYRDTSMAANSEPKLIFDYTTGANTRKKGAMLIG
jgi:hypothetical protein